MRGINGQIMLQLPSEIDEDLKKLWLDTAKEAFEEILEKQKVPRYLNQGEASNYLRISENFFKGYVKDDIPHIAIGSVIRYDRLELDKFYKNHSSRN